MEQYLAKIHKDAGINLSQESQILDDKQSYNLVLQNMGYFEEMAEKMDLKSINRYQFRSNRPEGEILWIMFERIRLTRINICVFFEF